MKGYVARDKDSNDLWVHYIKPRREYMMWVSDGRIFEIHNEDFPEFKDLTWNDEPVEVEFTIKKIKL